MIIDIKKRRGCIVGNQLRQPCQSCLGRIRLSSASTVPSVCTPTLLLLSRLQRWGTSRCSRKHSLLRILGWL